MFGTGSDLRIYHDGGNSYIAYGGTGSLFIQGTSLKLQDAGGHDYIAMTDTGSGGTIELKHNAVTKLATTATGIDVTGVITTDGMTTSADINFGDNDKAIFGASDDFQIYHDGTSGHTFLKESGSGSTILQTNTFVLQNAAGTQNIIMAPEGTSGIDFSYNGSVKLSTESNGIIVNGEVQATSLDISGSADIDGTLEADAITLNGTALGSLYSPIAGGSGIVTTGALNSGTITSGFGTINNGASTITTSGAVATGTLNTTGDITLSGELNLSSATNAYIDFADALHIRAIGSSPAYEDSIYCLKNAQTVLMYNGAGKINTTNTGVGVTGDVVASGNVTAYSDLRIKDNLEVIPDALSKVEQLNGYTYTRTDLEDKQEKHTGVIAQEVLKVLPEAVVLGETPEDNMAVAYGNMVGLLIEAVKELSAKVKELEGK
jgi:cytoskeletal protein CcmA (bactofilin family)